jgi:DUF1707 SHOCT-like domain/Cell wall-active antibiotics response LiaF, C-terminal
MSGPDLPAVPEGDRPDRRPASDRLPSQQQSDLERFLGESARVLISDKDRNRVADVIGDAFAEGRLTHAEYEERLTTTMSARTLTDLAPVVEGLPPATAAAALAPLLPGPVPAAAAGTSADPVQGWFRLDETSTDSTAVAIFGGATRKGEWAVPERMTAVAVFGGVELDLTKAQFTAKETTITANAVFGGVDITVPEGITVIVNGAGVFGGFDGRAEGPGVPGAPVLRVGGVAFFGGVDVKRKKRRRGGREVGGSKRPELPR